MAGEEDPEALPKEAYNAQAAVDAGGSRLIVSARIGQCASDRNELVADIAAIPAVLGRPETVLADRRRPDSRAGHARGAAPGTQETVEGLRPPDPSPVGRSLL